MDVLLSGSSLLALGLGIIVGVVLGTLGGGGSILAVPSLVYLLGQSAHEAATGSLVVVIASALTGVIAHARHGNVRMKQGLAFGGAGLVTSIVGGTQAARIPDTVILGGLAIVMLAASVLMWQSSKRPVKHADLRQLGRRHTMRAILAGAGVGLLIGIFGVGGGFLAVPALVTVAGLGITEAVGTSLLIMVINSSAALAARAAGSDVDWAVIVPFALAASVAAVGGQRLSRRFRPAVLQRAFAILLVLIASWMAIDQLVLH